MNSEDRRAFTRHPVKAPLRVYPHEGQDVLMRDIGHGGMAFHSKLALKNDTLLIAVIPHLQPPFEETCVVCWQKPDGDGFETGVRFLDQEALFRLRMVEQVCHIEAYHQEQAGVGRVLTLEESAGEWIEKHAADYGLIAHE